MSLHNVLLLLHSFQQVFATFGDLWITCNPPPRLFQRSSHNYMVKIELWHLILNRLNRNELYGAEKEKETEFSTDKLGFICNSILFPIHETYFHLVLFYLRAFNH
jgi:hypothetical protein